MANWLERRRARKAEQASILAYKDQNKAVALFNAANNGDVLSDEDSAFMLNYIKNNRLIFNKRISADNKASLFKELALAMELPELDDEGNIIETPEEDNTWSMMDKASLKKYIDVKTGRFTLGDDGKYLEVAPANYNEALANYYGDVAFDNGLGLDRSQFSSKEKALEEISKARASAESKINNSSLLDNLKAARLLMGGDTTFTLNGKTYDTKTINNYNYFKLNAINAGLLTGKESFDEGFNKITLWLQANGLKADGLFGNESMAKWEELQKPYNRLELSANELEESSATEGFTSRPSRREVEAVFGRSPSGRTTYLENLFTHLTQDSQTQSASNSNTELPKPKGLIRTPEQVLADNRKVIEDYMEANKDATGFFDQMRAGLGLAYHSIPYFMNKLVFRKQQGGTMIKRFANGGSATLQDLEKLIMLGAIGFVALNSEDPMSAIQEVMLNEQSLQKAANMFILLPDDKKQKCVQTGYSIVLKLQGQQQLTLQPLTTGSMGSTYNAPPTSTAYGDNPNAAIAARKGAKISLLNGHCPEGYEVEKYLAGGCVKCRRGKLLKAMAIASKQRFKKEEGGEMDFLKCGGKKKHINKSSKGSAITKDNSEFMKCGGKKIKKHYGGGPVVQELRREPGTHNSGRRTIPGIGLILDGGNNVEETNYNNGAAIVGYSEYNTPNARTATLSKINKRNNWDKGIVENDSIFTGTGRNQAENRANFYELRRKGGFENGIVTEPERIPVWLLWAHSLYTKFFGN